MRIFNDIINATIYHKYPIYLIQFVTERCNAKCEHCFVNFKNADEELTLEQIEKIASSSGPCLRNIGITGGEPFIRDDIFEIADIWYKNSSATSLSLTTNGSFPERIEAYCKKAAEKNVPTAFLMSYDYIGEKHSEYRKLKDLHLKVTESYKIIKSFGKSLSATFQITLTPDNADSIEETYKYIRDVLKIQNINITMVRGKSSDNATFEERSKMAEAYKKLERQRCCDFDLYKIKGFDSITLTEKILNAKNKMQWKYVLKEFTEKKYISPCSAGSLFGTIWYNGNVSTCEPRETPVGNLKDFDFDFMKLWTSPAVLSAKKDIKCFECNCTFEPAWLVNIISSPRYYPELLFNMIKNSLRNSDDN